MAIYNVRHGSVTVILDDSILKSKLYHAQKVLNAQVMIDSSPFVPNRKGILSISVHPENDYKEVVWNTPYAQFQWYGKVMVGIKSRKVWANKGEKKEVVVPERDLKYHKNPTASAFWFEKAKKQNLDRWIAKVKGAVK